MKAAYDDIISVLEHSGHYEAANGLRQLRDKHIEAKAMLFVYQTQQPPTINIYYDKPHETLPSRGESEAEEVAVKEANQGTTL